MSPRSVRVLVKGTALHFFDAGLGQNGSDKFYRAFIFQSGSSWSAIQCWGRDGTQGQSKLTEFSTEYDARKAIDKKINEKMRHGYEILGQGEVVLDVLKRTEVLLGQEFADAVSERDPDKTRMSGGIIIHEEPDLMDLLG